LPLGQYWIVINATVGAYEGHIMKLATMIQQARLLLPRWLPLYFSLS